MSAVVLEIPDLLLCIADHLHCARSLSRMSRVCRLWRDVLCACPPLVLRHRMVSDFEDMSALTRWWKRWKPFSWSFFIQVLLPKDVDFTAGMINLLQPLRANNAGVEIRYKDHVVMILIHQRWLSRLPEIRQLSDHRLHWHSFNFCDAPLLLVLDRTRL